MKANAAVLISVLSKFADYTIRWQLEGLPAGKQASRQRIGSFSWRCCMVCRSFCVVALLGALAAKPAWGADGKYSIKQADTPAPQEISEPIRKLLADKSLQLLDDKGAVICELWFRAALPVKATPE